MKAITMLETIRSLLGAPACAIPLSSCKVAKGYLLERAGIPATGTAILFPIPYVMTADVDNPTRNLSLYAVPRDYHGYIQKLSDTLIPALRDAFPAHRFALFADHSPIREVDAAARAGLGVVGQHGLLITPEYGSFLFIGEIITDADYLSVTGSQPPCFPDEPPLCEGCGACVAACPGGCEGTDRTGCLSALTQKKGALTPDEVEAIRQNHLVWGCDVCQLVCPHNARAVREGRDTPIPYFREHRVIRLDIPSLDAMSEEEFAARAYSWRGRAVIRRNAELFEPKSSERSMP